MSKNNVFIKRIIGFSLASWVNCIISFISTPITTALFVPEQLGKINLFISYSNILIPFIYLGFDQAYARFFYEPPGKNNKNSLLNICMCISAIMFVFVSVFIAMWRKFYSVNIIGYESNLIIFVLIAYIFATVIMRYMNLEARMENKTLLFSIQSILVTMIIKLGYVFVAFIKPIAEYALALSAGLMMVHP